MLARYNHLDSVFHSLFDDFAFNAAPVRDWRRLTVQETENALNVTLDVPGMNEKDLAVELHEDVLTIRGERKSEDKAEQKILRAAGLKFEKSFSLPYKVDSEAATAAVKDGVLTITLPKTPEAKPRAIAVSASK